MRKDWWNLHTQSTEQYPSYRQPKPLSDRTRAVLIAKLKQRGKLANIHTPDRSLIRLLQDTRRHVSK